jgi:hypothetical protein
MEWQAFLPGIIGSFVGVMGWLAVGIYIQRRQFMRQARNAAKAVYFELDVNRSAVGVAREHGLFSELDRSSFERLLPELATLLRAHELRTVVEAYKTHAGFRQLASRDDLPEQVRRAALGTYADVHDGAIATLQSRAFSADESRALDATVHAAAETLTKDDTARVKP